MTRRMMLALIGTGLLGASGLVADEKQGHACGRKTDSKKAETAKMRCSLTGQEVKECCCVTTKEGKMHCTLADKDVETCCCTDAPADNGGEQLA